MISDFFHSVPKWYIIIFTSFFSAIGTLSLWTLKEYYSRSKKFQEIIHTELQGIYPSIESYLSEGEINDRIWQSITPIQVAVTNFRTILPFSCKSRFDIAAKRYYETARKTDWKEQTAHQFYPEMAKPGYISPKEKLNKAVNDLLKFAK